MSERYLENVALWYLQRFAASADSLRRVLLRRVETSARAHDTDRAEGAALVEAIIARYQQSGLLDDSAYARVRALSLHRRGASIRTIRVRLKAKGIGGGDTDLAIRALAQEAAEPDLVAAIAYARRRRLGPWRTCQDRDTYKQRDLAALARNGFDYDTARRVIEASGTEQLERESGA
ncbi:MAG: RecX family transcriptional regulator [Alphaproteobacteria bacterium]